MIRDFVSKAHSAFPRFWCLVGSRCKGTRASPFVGETVTYTVSWAWLCNLGFIEGAQWRLVFI